MEVNELEKHVLKTLHDEIDKIIGKEVPSAKLIKSIVDTCSSWVFPILFEKYDPKEIAETCMALIRKKLLIEFKCSSGYPAFIPVSRTRIVEYSYRDFTQNDIL